MQVGVSVGGGEQECGLSWAGGAWEGSDVSDDVIHSNTFTSILMPCSFESLLG